MKRLLATVVACVGVFLFTTSELYALDVLPEYTNLIASATKQLKVNGFGIAIPIRDFYRTCTTGTRLEMFQESERYYIAKVLTIEFGEQLCAFPKRDHTGMGTAWVTNEKLLIFGTPTRTCAGKLYLLKDEVMPIIEETDAAYKVLLARHGFNIPFDIPKYVKDLLVEDIPKPVEKPKVVKKKRKKIDDKVITQMLYDGKKPEKKKSWFAKKEEPTKVVMPDAQPKAKPKPEPVKKAKPKPKPEPEPEVVEEPEEEKEEVATGPKTPWWKRFKMPISTLLSQVIVLALIVQVFLFMRKRKGEPIPEPAPAASSQEVQTFSTMGESTAANYFQDLAHDTGDFSGSLEGFSITELVQFLHSAQETGVLHIKDVSDDIAGRFYFQQGEIIDATYKKKSGEDAVYALFSNKDASFAFNRQSLDGRPRTISQQTMGLLLEASKTYDEETNGGGGNA
jgi:hypothetical protein